MNFWFDDIRQNKDRYMDYIRNYIYIIQYNKDLPAMPTPSIQNVNSADSIPVSNVSSLGFFEQFQYFASSRIARLKKTILGDAQYQSKNTFNLKYKQKIFSYLHSKYMTTIVQLEDEEGKKFTSFDSNYGTNIQFRNLSHMKEVLLKLKTHIEAAEDSIKQSQITQKQLKANYFNEIAYQFNRQRKSSICWGLLFASIICATIYRNGSIPRKAALFLTTGHVFGQVSYHMNIDKFFDMVYPIFEEDALEYIRQQQADMAKNEGIKGISVVED